MKGKIFRNSLTKGFVPLHYSPIQIMQTDYSKVNNVLLAYPERFYNEYESLTSFYEAFIDIIPNSLQLWIVCNNQSSIQKLKQKYYYKINKLSKIIIKECISEKIINLPLKLDGGNFVNNNSIALLTDKVVADN